MLARNADETGLAACTAIVVAHDDQDGASLVALAKRVGFGSVSSFADQQAEGGSHHLVFFLVHYGIGTSAKQALLAKVRSSPSISVSFAPVILFIPDGPGAETLSYIEMGFDDVICLPENSHVLASRLAGQIGKEHLYIETRTYLGPDRRRMELPGHTHPGRTGEFDHTKLWILRSPHEGVQVLRRQLFVSAH